jgi:copper oxidase (laccase) domain-containing protein
MRELRTADGRTGLQFDRLGAEPGLLHVLPTRAGAAGNLSLSGGRDRAAACAERARWCRALGLDPAALTVGGQVHGAAVARVGAAERGRGATDPASVIPATDALVCAEPGVPLYCAGADCAPLLLWARGPRPALAVAHAGWRGLRAGVVAAAVAELCALSGAAPGELLAGIGPCIGPPAYQVGPEVVEDAPPAAVGPDLAAGRWQLDLAAWAEHALCAAGRPRAAVERSGCNTARDARFFSHRRDGAATGRLGLIAALAPA